MAGNALSYFPLDCVIDDNFKLVEAEFGLKGFAVVVKLWQRIYGGRGYFCDWNNDVALMFAKECSSSDCVVGVTVVSEIVRASIKRGIFDARMYEAYGILTSAGIQRRWFSVMARSKTAKVREEYLLINAPKNIEVDNTFSENVCKNTKNVSIFEQRKGKEEEGRYTARAEFIATEWRARLGDNLRPEAANQIAAAAADMTDDLVAAAISAAALGSQQNPVTYVLATLKNCASSGITTLAAYNAAKQAREQAKAERAETKPARGKQKKAKADCRQRTYGADVFKNIGVDLLGEEMSGNE